MILDPAILAAGLHLASPAALAERLSAGQWRRAVHLDVLSSKLVDVAMGDCPRLMVLMPPRHGKSQMCSHWFPSWFLGLMPHKRIMFSSYAADFARDWGRLVRNTVSGHWPELGVTVAEDSKASHRWHTAEGGGMTTAGVGGDFTGKGGELLILDDPTKNAEEAMSSTIQKRNWEWWKSTWRTRLQPGGAMVVIGTPWDVGDLIGMLRAAHAKGSDAEGYEPWEVLHLPALAEAHGDALGREPGEPLWPSQYDAAALHALKKSVGSHWWVAQYQGRPTPIGGDLIKERWWNYWQPKGAGLEPPVVDGRTCELVELPELDIEIQSWDMNFHDEVRAAMKGDKPDPVSGQVWGRSGADKFLLARRYGHWTLNETVEEVRGLTTDRPKATTKLVEYTANGPAVIARLRHEIGGFVPVTPRGSKMSRVMSAGASEADRHARATSMIADVESGNFYLPHPSLYPWVGEYRSLMGKFPSKPGRDDADATSQAWARLAGPAWAEEEREAKNGPPEPPAQTVVELVRRQRRDEYREESRWRDKVPGTPRRRVAVYRRGRV